MDIDDQNQGAPLPVANTSGKVERCTIPGTLFACEDFVLTTLAVTVSELLEEALAPLDLRLRHYRLLIVLLAEGPRAQSSIGATLSIDRTTVVGLVDRLEAMGAVRRVRCDDRRAYLVELTAKGKRLVKDAMTRVNRAEEKIFAPLSASEREELRRLSAQLFEQPGPVAARYQVD